LTAFPLVHPNASRCTYIVKACGSGSGVQTKTFIVDFASAGEERWEALLEELKSIEVGVLGA
jgi:hypothetical protein